MEQTKNNKQTDMTFIYKSQCENNCLRNTKQPGNENEYKIPHVYLIFILLLYLLFQVGLKRGGYPNNV